MAKKHTSFHTGKLSPVEFASVRANPRPKKKPVAMRLDIVATKNLQKTHGIQCRVFTVTNPNTGKIYQKTYFNWMPASQRASQPFKYPV